MILFGGCTTSRRSLGSIYILDMKTLSWAKGPDVDPTQNRSGMACAVAGDNFVAWGGIFSNLTQSMEFHATDV